MVEFADFTHRPRRTLMTEIDPGSRHWSEAHDEAYP
jgi:hypothetical protein